MPTTPGAAQAAGICISVADPLVWSHDRRGWAEQFNDAADGWEQETTAGHGFYAATLSLRARTDEVERWLLRGLGRDVRATGSAGQTVWEGFVNQVNADVGGKSLTVGPLVEVGNRAMVAYALRDETTNPPTDGVEAFTTLADDTDSQYLYGIWEKVISGGKMTAANAGQLRDTALAELRWPQTSREIAPQGDVSLRVECLGYWAWLQAYVYQYTADVLSVTAEAKVRRVVEADPNGIFSADTSGLGENGWLVCGYEGDNRLAWDVLGDVVKLGDANDVRWTFGVYDGRRVQYRAMPEEIAYQNRVVLGDEVETFAPPGGIVRPWDVRPARWLFFADFPSGAPLPVTRDQLLNDPRALFVESVRFVAPDALYVNGERVGTLRQMLAKSGGG